MKRHIWLSPPHFTGNELHYLQETIASKWLSVVGPHKEKFASAICNYVKIGIVDKKEDLFYSKIWV